MFPPFADDYLDEDDEDDEDDEHQLQSAARLLGHEYEGEVLLTFLLRPSYDMVLGKSVCRKVFNKTLVFPPM